MDRSQEQYDHVKAKESTRHAREQAYDSIASRFQDDDLHRIS